MGGPYNGRDGRGPATDFNHCDPEHPTPHDEGLKLRYGIHRCGFKDMGQMNKWFNPEEQMIITKAGFKLVERKAESVEYGEKQVIFIPYVEPDETYVEVPEVDMSVEF